MQKLPLTILVDFEAPEEYMMQLHSDRINRIQQSILDKYDNPLIIFNYIGGASETKVRLKIHNPNLAPIIADDELGKAYLNEVKRLNALIASQIQESHVGQ